MQLSEVQEFWVVLRQRFEFLIILGVPMLYGLACNLSIVDRLWRGTTTVESGAATGLDRSAPLLTCLNLQNIMQRFVEILQEHQRSTKTDTLRVQVLCERYSKRYGESMHPKKVSRS